MGNEKFRFVPISLHIRAASASSALSKDTGMTIQITLGVRNIMFRLDWKNRRWHSLEEPEEADFPLIAVVEGKRYELYSDGTFDEVEK